jgi:hypothetical protein
LPEPAAGLLVDGPDVEAESADVPPDPVLLAAPSLAGALSAPSFGGALRLSVRRTGTLEDHADGRVDLAQPPGALGALVSAASVNA